MDTTFKSRTRGELIPTVIIEFHDLPNLWMTKDRYKDSGGYQGLLKNEELSIREIKKIHHLLKNPKDFPENEWPS